MPVVTVRNLPEETHRALKLRAAHHGRSTEAEVRAILEAAMRPIRIRLGAGLRRAARALRERRSRPRARPGANRTRRIRMIILDTNVVCRPLRAHGNPAVQAWLDRQALDTLSLTATSLLELLVGVEILPEGRRRDGLADALTQLILRLFKPASWPSTSKPRWPMRAWSGAPVPAGSTFRWRTARSLRSRPSIGFTVATRDTAPFEAAASCPCVKPWT